MHKLWKKRLKAFFSDGEAIIAHLFVGGLGGLFVSIFTNLIFSLLLNFNMFSVTVVTVLSTIIACFGISMYEVMTDENMEYDKEILKEEKKAEKEIEIKKQIEKEKKEAHLLHLEKMMPMLRERDKELAELTEANVLTIKHILDTYQLPTNEDHYLMHSLPKDVKESMDLYMQLDEKNQIEMKPMIAEMLKQKKEELENHFILKYQNDIKEKLKIRVELVKAREY